MTNNSSGYDPNFHITLHPSNAINTNPNLQFALSPSYEHGPKKKRTKTVASCFSSSPKSISKPKYTKKPDPNAPKITRPCTECGRKFWSLKALFGHMRCHPERQWRGINPPPNHRNPSASSSKQQNQRSPNWVSFMSEDHEAASCLLMLSNSTPSSSFSERFECGICKKVFGSHQALGGHRASHKNVKGCFAITNVADDGPITVTASTDQDHQGKIFTFSGHHKCNICFRVLSSGHALGGHLRCHWQKEEEPMTIDTFDLNVPPTTQDLSTTYNTSGCSLDLTLRLGI